MRYYTIEPDVPGGLGEHSVLDTTVRPGIVHYLHYEFEGWFGDDLLTSNPIFLVTERLAKALRKAHPTGMTLADVEISKSDIFMELHPDLPLPNFLWLQVHGTPGKDDFGFSRESGYSLVVSERILQILKQFNIEHCEISDYPVGT